MYESDALKKGKNSAMTRQKRKKERKKKASLAHWVTRRPYSIRQMFKSDQWHFTACLPFLLVYLSLLHYPITEKNVPQNGLSGKVAVK